MTEGDYTHPPAARPPSRPPRREPRRAGGGQPRRSTDAARWAAAGSGAAKTTPAACARPECATSLPCRIHLPSKPLAEGASGLSPHFSRNAGNPKSQTPSTKQPPSPESSLTKASPQGRGQHHVVSAWTIEDWSLGLVWRLVLVVWWFPHFSPAAGEKCGLAERQAERAVSSGGVSCTQVRQGANQPRQRAG